ncbi:hypothetical protein K7432_010904 [Basidiobolus ranarum]|uniref:Carboxylesterase type B domain-containing protein n=1 Tax=Basidiobolus ranarum TaxID=34480 RepID=A0ABR2VUW9_9FUNG
MAVERNSPSTSIELEQGAYGGLFYPTHRALLNIPYAQAPVGNLRWRKPQKLCPNLDKIYDATRVGKPRDGWPIIVWLHGGGYQIGANSSPVYENISHFGDDNTRTCAFGGSAGSISIAHHLVTSRGLFHRAILETGGADTLPPSSIDIQQECFDELCELLSVSGDDKVAQLREISSERLVEVMTKMSEIKEIIIGGNTTDAFFFEFASGERHFRASLKVSFLPHASAIRQLYLCDTSSTSDVLARVYSEQLFSGPIRETARALAYNKDPTTPEEE